MRTAGRSFSQSVSPAGPRATFLLLLLLSLSCSELSFFSTPLKTGINICFYSPLASFLLPFPFSQDAALLQYSISLSVQTDRSKQQRQLGLAIKIPKTILRVLSSHLLIILTSTIATATTTITTSIYEK